MRPILICFIWLAVAGCEGNRLNPGDAQAEIATFHAAYNSGDYSAIYSGGSASFKCSVDAETFGKQLAAWRSTTGQYISHDFVREGGDYQLKRFETMRMGKPVPDSNGIVFTVVSGGIAIPAVELDCG